MAFTDAEMAVLSQMAYAEVKTDSSGTISLAKFMRSKNCREMMEKQFGVTMDANGHYSGDSEYANVLNGLYEKVNGKDYNIIKHVTNESSKNNSILRQLGGVNELRKNAGNGFAAFAISDPDNVVTVACRGTELNNGHNMIQDLNADLIGIGLQKKSDQHIKMEQFVSELEAEGYNKFYFTGHSLGGNNAVHGALNVSPNSEVLGVRTFNAPGFSKIYRKYNNVDNTRFKDRITNYSNENDFVSSIYDPIGKTVVVKNNHPNPYEPSTSLASHSQRYMVLSGSGNGFVPNGTGRKAGTPTIISVISSALNIAVFGAYVIADGVYDYVTGKTVHSGSGYGSRSAVTYAYSGNEVYITPRLFMEAATDGSIGSAGNAVVNVQAKVQELLAIRYPSSNVFLPSSLGTLGTMDIDRMNQANQLQSQIKSEAAQINETNEKLKQVLTLITEVSETIRKTTAYMYETGEAFQSLDNKIINQVNNLNGNIGGKQYATNEYSGQLSDYVKSGTGQSGEILPSTKSVASKAALEMGKDFFGAMGKIAKLPETITKKGPYAFVDTTWSLINGAVALGSDAVGLTLAGLSTLATSAETKEYLIKESIKYTEQDKVSDFCKNQITEGKDPADYDFFDKMWDGAAKMTRTLDATSDVYSIGTKGKGIVKDAGEILSGESSFGEYILEQAGVTTDPNSSDYMYSNTETIASYLESYFVDDGSGDTGFQRAMKEAVEGTDFGKIYKKSVKTAKFVQEVVDEI